MARAYCKENKINYVLPPTHTTQILQHLDVGIFNVYKVKYRSERKTLLKVDFISKIEDSAGIKKLTEAVKD